MAEGYSAIPLSPLRKIIAGRMTEAKQNIPHYRLVTDVGADSLIAAREELRLHRPAGSPSLNDLIIKATASALMEVPGVNVQWTAEAIHQQHSADISVIVQVDGGLTMPIVRRAQQKSIWEISAEVRDFVHRAARNALRMDEISGGSFSITNLGRYGIEQFDAIINSPQCAILAVGAARPALSIGENHEVLKGMRMYLTLSVDHRAIDGATAATFMAALKRRIQVPQGLCEGRSC